MKKSVFLGVDLGSVSTNLVLIDEKTGEVQRALYLRTQGRPIEALKKGLSALADSGQWQVLGAGTTGSGRRLAQVVLNADLARNEITAHSIGAAREVPDVATVLEIGGQDSKIIIIRNGVATDFAMNTVCAAGTGSFLDQQAARLGIPIEEFGEIALRSRNPVRIAGRCTVFAESDMIHKQQLGCNLSDILYGLCQAMVRNYLNNVGKGKDIKPPIVFQGGVAANVGIRKAFEEALGEAVHIPKHFNVMGAIGAAQLAKEAIEAGRRTSFRGFELVNSSFESGSFECRDCVNNCEVVELRIDGEVAACWGDRCGKYANLEKTPASVVS